MEAIFVLVSLVSLVMTVLYVVNPGDKGRMRAMKYLRVTIISLFLTYTYLVLTIIG